MISSLPIVELERDASRDLTTAFRFLDLKR
jgi:hypothetical protein